MTLDGSFGVSNIKRSLGLVHLHDYFGDQLTLVSSMSTQIFYELIMRWKVHVKDQQINVAIHDLFF